MCFDASTKWDRAPAEPGAVLRGRDAPVGRSARRCVPRHSPLQLSRTSVDTRSFFILQNLMIFFILLSAPWAFKDRRRAISGWKEINLQQHPRDTARLRAFRRDGAPRRGSRADAGGGGERAARRPAHLAGEMRPADGGGREREVAVSAGGFSAFVWTTSCFYFY